MLQICNILFLKASTDTAAKYIDSQPGRAGRSAGACAACRSVFSI
jgi:hypothetical protein